MKDHSLNEIQAGMIEDLDHYAKIRNLAYLATVSNLADSMMVDLLRREWDERLEERRVDR